MEMKRVILISILWFFHLLLQSQVIKGTILDKTTKEPVISAAVFFSGTSVGTLTDIKGNFVLDISKHSSMPLTVSAIGYYSITLNSYTKDKPVTISLNPKTFELNEVVVKEKSQSFKRSANLAIFRSEFLGTTANSMNCVITNEKDIRFKTSEDKDTLRALSINPILIVNKALGYKITYYLDKFEYYKTNQSFLFEGKILIVEDSTSSGSKKTYFERKRKDTYLGSRMHFLRSLWTDNLNHEGFSVKNSASETIGYRKIVLIKGNNLKYLCYPAGIGISYYSKQPTSFLNFRKREVYFEASGYYEPDGIIWEGEMSRQRIADLLPYDYDIAE